MVSITGQAMFFVALMLGYILEAFSGEPQLAVIFFAVATVVGATIAICADFFIDMKKYLAKLDPRADVQLPNALTYLGGTALGLGVVGIILIIINSQWSNTVLVAIEVTSVILGIILLVFGKIIMSKRIKLVTSLLNKMKSVSSDTKVSENNA